MNLADRLRGVVRPQPLTQLLSRDAAENIDETLDGEWREAGGQRYLVIDRTYSPGYRHGRVCIADCLPSPDGWPGLEILADPRRPGVGAPDAKLLFFDLETTGLAGGAGTYAFLAGCGWFDEGTFRTRQFFLSSFAAERVLLEALGGLAGASGALVTYNGKTFDVPLIDTRFLYHRLATPFPDLAHVDMLHSARRLWRSDDEEGALQGSCRLIALEQSLLGHEREGDVPGFEIPSRYFHFVRTSDARPLQAVLEHNRLDLISLAMLTARAAHLLAQGADAAATAREALGLGRLYERARRHSAAQICYARATTFPADTLTQAEAFRALALLCRRQRRYEAAADAWRQLLDLRRCPPAFAREATEALAVHHEHRLRDLQSARTFALRSLGFLPAEAGSHAPAARSLRRTEALHHRLARLNRKLGHTQADPAPLF